MPLSKKRWLEPVAGFEDVNRSVTLADFYLIKTIGKGAYGKVVSIKSKKTGKDYAMKIMTKKVLVKYKMMKQLLNEINIMKKLAHENIIRYQTHFEDDEYIYLILDLADEGHLFDRLSKKGVFSEDEAAKLIFQLLKAVNYMHSREPPIIHRDIKPENILFMNDQIKLADFGWSCCKDKLKRGTFCGTRIYLAPEMLLKKGHDEKLDVWTIGVIFYELCTGKTPFSPEGLEPNSKQFNYKLEKNILTMEPVYPQSLSLEATLLMKKMLKKNQKERITCLKALRHPFFQKYSHHFNAAKENLINKIVSRSKKHLERKKMRRIFSQDSS